MSAHQNLLSAQSVNNPAMKAEGKAVSPKIPRRNAEGTLNIVASSLGKQSPVMSTPRRSYSRKSFGGTSRWPSTRYHNIGPVDSAATTPRSSINEMTPSKHLPPNKQNGNDRLNSREQQRKNGNRRRSRPQLLPKDLPAGEHRTSLHLSVQHRTQLQNLMDGDHCADELCVTFMTMYEELKMVATEDGSHIYEVYR